MVSTPKVSSIETALRGSLPIPARSSAAAIHMLCASTLASLAAPQQLLLIRHGVTNMNVYLSKNPYGQRGFYDPGDYDTRLTDDGREMAAALNPILTEDHARAPIELLVSSPLTRALQTASLAMDGLDGVPRVANADISERRYLSSDVGRNPSELAAEYPLFAPSLSALPSNWWWEDETAAGAAEAERLSLQGGTTLRGVSLPVEPNAHFLARLESFRGWLEARPERKIAIVAHWGVFYACLGRSLKNCELVSCTTDDLLSTLCPTPDE